VASDEEALTHEDVLWGIFYGVVVAAVVGAGLLIGGYL
jgi:hypothetical protein